VFGGRVSEDAGGFVRKDMAKNARIATRIAEALTRSVVGSGGPGGRDAWLSSLSLVVVALARARRLGAGSVGGSRWAL
jgi:hypothetical protein